jgi:hypothetical protein
MKSSKIWPPAEMLRGLFPHASHYILTNNPGIGAQLAPARQKQKDDPPSLQIRRLSPDTGEAKGGGSERMAHTKAPKL